MGAILVWWESTLSQSTQHDAHAVVPAAPVSNPVGDEKSLKGDFPCLPRMTNTRAGLRFWLSELFLLMDVTMDI